MDQQTLASVWRELPIDPTNILKKYAFSVAMGPRNIGGAQEGWTLGHAMGTELRLCDPDTIFRLGDGAKINVSVFAVPMIGGDDDISDEMILTVTDESKICVTPTLTGCSVGIKKEGKNVKMFHKRPAGGAEDGVSLQRRLNESQEGFHVRGKINYINVRTAAIIGVNVFGWEFYLQKFDRTDGGLTVTGVSRIGID